jgi:hypothetical protein
MGGALGSDGIDDGGLQPGRVGNEGIERDKCPLLYGMDPFLRWGESELLNHLT